MTKLPSISVLLPVYNAERFVSEAINSVLNQTFVDFEFIILNDGSSDSSDNIIRSFTDSRIVYVNNHVNNGLIDTLNNGVQLARGKYIVRMDADDVCFTNRLELQYDFMEKNPDVAVSGGQMVDFDQKRLISRVEIDSAKLKTSLLFTCVLAHPTVIMRADVIKSHGYFYDSAFPHSEDYELWSRIARRFKIANIKNDILSYRFHEQQVSRMHSEVQIQGMKKCQRIQFEFAGFSLTDAELNLHSKISSLNFDNSVSFYNMAVSWFEKLLQSTELVKVYSQDSLKTVIGDWYYNLTGELLNARIPIKKNILISPLTYKCLSISRMLKLFVKVIVK